MREGKVFFAYRGPLFGKRGRKYIPLKMSSEDVDGMERDLNQCKQWITAARERLQEMPADEETVELINTCPWWDSPEND